MAEQQNPQQQSVQQSSGQQWQPYEPYPSQAPGDAQTQWQQATDVSGQQQWQQPYAGQPDNAQQPAGGQPGYGQQPSTSQPGNAQQSASQPGYGQPPQPPYANQPGYAQQPYPGQGAYAPQPFVEQYGPHVTHTPDGRKLVSKVAYVLLAFFLGGLGIHNFYAGKVGLGILFLVFCWTFIPSIAAFVQAIIALCKTSDAYGRIAI